VGAPTRTASKRLNGWALAPLALALLCGNARIGAEDAPKEGWRIEEAHFRFNYFDQKGFGYQSQAGPGPAGSERLHVYEPMFYLRARQNSKVEHTVTVPVDIITSASTDAIDATTSASRHNEAGTLQIDTRVKQTEDDALKFTYGGHVEEWFSSIFGGVGYTRDLAQDNATISARIAGSFDWFKPYGPRGDLVPPGNRFDVRGGLTGSVEVSQILSPTTWVKAGYEITWRKGELLTPWNSVPFLCDPEVTVCVGRVQEKFPRTRLRQTVSGLLAHYVPRTKSTVRASYRFYGDDYDVRAHTLLAEIYQSVTERAYVSAHYRAHHQTAVYFWTTNLGLLDFNPNAPRTSDSDLARFWAHEWGAKVLIHLTPPGRTHQHHADVYFNRYTRTNNLSVNVGSLGYGYNF
jgi:hypothetical protein